MDLKPFFSNWIVRNIIKAIILIAVLMLCTQLLLTCVTQHGKQLGVPDFSGLSAYESSRIASNAGVRTEVVDSIYVKRMPRGAVVRQDPKPGSMVKEGRRVHLTINAVSAKRIPMPDLVGYSLRSARAELESRGLELGKLIYVNDMATNNVLRQLYRNSEIRPGRMVDSQSSIDLVLGLNPDEGQTSVPDVVGSKYRRAVDMIHDNSLNVGTVRFDKSVKTYQDSLNAVVYNQSPTMDEHSVGKGRGVSIYLTVDENKITHSVRSAEGNE